MKERDSAKRLFDMIEKIGETIDGPFHILDMGEGSDHYEQSYRVYHSGGYCFDSYKEDVTDEADTKTRYEYGFNPEWPEFAILDEDGAINLINEYFQSKNNV